MIQFTKPGQSGSLSVVGKMRTEVQEALVAAGMPAKLYLLALDKAPTSQWLAENGLQPPVEGIPTISQKNGSILYNFGGRSTVAQTDGRLQGNFFLPKDGFTVEPATHRAFVAAKVAAAAAYANRRSASEPTEEDLEAGESA